MAGDPAYTSETESMPLGSQRCRQSPQILSPIQIAVDEDLFRMATRELVEVREVVRVRCDRRDHLPADQHDDQGSSHPRPGAAVQAMRTDRTHDREQRIDREYVP